MQIRVHLLPSLTSAQEVAGGTLVVIDILRATTTMITALANGASEVLPCLEIADAKQIAARKGNAILGGERKGLKIEAFQCGNSPAEYSVECVKGRPVVITTTNGTRALMLGMGASEVLIGAFVNLSALCERLKKAERVELLCAGTDGHITLEDVLFAGAVVDRLTRGAGVPPVRITVSLNDSAHLARAAWQAAEQSFATKSLAAWFADSRGGKNLIDINQASDLALAAEIDRYWIVPVLHRGEWTLK